MRWFLTLTATFAAAALIVGGASAEPKVRCDVMPFTFSDAIVIDVDFGPNGARVETEATGSTTFDCGPLGVLGVDVWEHAYYLVSDSGRVGGRAQLVIDFGAGVTVPFEGSIRGRRAPGDDIIDIIVTATSPGRARIGLQQTATLDIDALTLDLEVNDGFFDIWTDLT